MRAELQAIDPLLDIRWQPAWVWNDKQQTFEGRYVLTCHWPQTDRRWRDLDHQGDTFDILGAFTENIEDATSIPVTPEAMIDIVIARLATFDGERFPHTQRLAQIAEKNKLQSKLNAQLVEDEAVDALEYEFDRWRGTPKVNVLTNLENNG